MCIANATYLKKPKHPIIWNGGSSILALLHSILFLRFFVTHHASPRSFLDRLGSLTVPLLHVVVLLGLNSLQASCSAATDMVSPGNGLVGSSRRRLVSNNSKFFKPDSTPFRHTTSNPNTYLGIWFNKVPKLTPLWSATATAPWSTPPHPSSPSPTTAT